MYDEMLPS